MTFDTKEKVLPQGIHMWNMKALTIQKLWSMWNIFMDKQTDKQGKSYMPWSINAGA